MLLKHKNITIRKMKHEDLRLMMKWLNDDQVLAFYEEPPSDWKRIVKKYRPRIEGNHYVTPCIIEYDDQPIGYIQYYEIQPKKLDEYGILLNNGKLYGIDQFIGEPTLWGKGIGTQMIRMILSELNRKGATKVLLEVNPENRRAIRAYEKCGFREIKDLENHLLLMEWTPDSN
ncbi:GNAT family N-acetyltransferase [Allobacillus sp. GCM10007491]|uniref:Acetyltransferase n=1 Tax=Allobacillus saliphilus TaxID=2912308 RepID=A0A941HTM7_9BACI|nr:GNAT family N-acetyltransferase [Allobacillus saliphilus]MBR7554092.1 acetyltransferase [Allobacillus saliphilus]